MDFAKRAQWQWAKRDTQQMALSQKLHGGFVNEPQKRSLTTKAQREFRLAIVRFRGEGCGR